MAGRQLKLVLGAVALVAAVVVAFLLLGSRPSTKDNAPVQSTPPAQQPVNTPIVIIPQTITIPDSPLRQSVIAAGDYLVRQQISNGELSYQVDFISGAREYSPSYIRLVAGTGALYTVCRISEDSKYCDAGDLALDKYLELLVSDPKRFAGICLYTTGSCQLGGSALTVDAIYKRWQATGNFTLGDRDLMNIAKNLGYFILSMRKPEGGFYHSYDPHYGGTVDADYFVVYFPGESLLALMELYEMTGNEFWLAQAREINNYMITQPVTEDHWHSYALNMFARLDTISQDDKNYAGQLRIQLLMGRYDLLTQPTQAYPLPQKSSHWPHWRKHSIIQRKNISGLTPKFAPLSHLSAPVSYRTIIAIGISLQKYRICLQAESLVVVKNHQSAWMDCSITSMA